MVDGDEGHHAANVVRVRAGDVVRLIDGDGVEALGRVNEVTRAAVDVGLLETRTFSRTDGLELTVAQALLKGRAFGEVVRKCAELGASEIVPLDTRRSIGRIPMDATRDRLERWEAVAAAAVKQSRGVFVPRMSAVHTVDELVKRVGDAGTALVAWEEERSTSLADALSGRRDGEVLLVVGPEGGLTADEVGLLTAAGALAVSVGRRILRADWAGAAIAAMISHQLGGLLP